MTEEEDPIPEEDPLSEEERRLEKRRRFRIAAGIGDLSAILFGTALILVLVALLINMIQFVTSDFSQNFSSPVYWRAFLDQLEENGIAYEIQPAVPLQLPEICLPWIRKQTSLPDTMQKQAAKKEKTSGLLK